MVDRMAPEGSAPATEADEAFGAAVMTPDSFQTYQKLETEISDIKASLARVETMLETVCKQRTEARDEHTRCRSEVEHELDRLDGMVTGLKGDFAKLTSWGRALAISGSVIVTVLTIVNILLAVGVKV